MMKKIYLQISLALLLLTLMLFPSIQAGARLEPFSQSSSALELIETINALREANGLSPYQADPLLMTIAQAHADYLAEAGVLSHFSADGKRPFQRALEAGYQVAGDLSLGGVFAENIHSGVNLTAADVVQVWQSHSSNSVTLLSEEFIDAGVGIATVDGVTYYVLDVGASDPSMIIPASTETITPTIALTGPVVVLNTALPNGEIFHTVRKDEALWSIAIAYAVTIEELKLLNGLASDEIFEGQTLLIRNASTPTFTPTVVVTATFGISTSTPTVPVTETPTSTPTPLPQAPTSLSAGGAVAGAIILIALLAAGIGALLGRKRREQSSD